MFVRFGGLALPEISLPEEVMVRGIGPAGQHCKGLFLRLGRQVLFHIPGGQPGIIAEIDQAAAYRRSVLQQIVQIGPGSFRSINIFGRGILQQGQAVGIRPGALHEFFESLPPH